MTPASATFKTLFQCRSLWLWHFFGLCVCLPPLLVPVFNSDFREGALLGLLIVPLWSGVMSASVAKDFSARPFSFVVPGHQSTWRRTLFSVGLAVTFACSFVFLLIQTGDPSAVVVRVWQVAWLSLLMYTAGVFAVSSTANTAFLPSLITLMLLFSLNQSLGAGIRGPFQQLALANPVLTTVVSALLITGAWRRMGSRAFVRMQSGQPFLPLHSIWSGDKQAIFNAERKVRSLRKSKGTVMNAAERFFLARMRAVSGRFTRKSLWGTLYVLAGRAAPTSGWYLLVGLAGLMVLTVVLGFYHPKRFPDGVSMANLTLYLVMAITAEYRINPHAALMLNISRRNRFRSLMLAAAAQLVVTAAVCGLLIVTSRVAGMYLDEVTALGNAWIYEPIVPKSLFLFLPMLPLFFVCQILFPRHTVFPVMIISIISVVIFAGNAEALLRTPPVGLAILQVVSWLPFVLLVRHHCYFWDLNLNGR
jgi:hypothetical protein